MRSKPGWVLDSRFTPDPLLVHPKNVVRERRSDTRKLLLANTIEIAFKDGGIQSVRSGDILLKGLVNVNVDLRYVLTYSFNRMSRRLIVLTATAFR